MKFRLFPLLVLILAVIPSASAYPLRVLAWDDTVAARKLAISHSKGTEELTNLDSFKRSKTFQVTPGEGSSAFIQCLDRNSPDGKPVVSEIKLTEGVKKPLLLLLPDAKSPSGLRLMALEDDLAGFNWGSIRLVNATGKKLVFKSEKRLTEVPATWTPVQVSPGGGDRNIQVQVFLHDQPDPALYSSVWEQRAYYRNLVFIMPGQDARIGAIECKFVNEDRRVQEAENAAGKAGGSQP